MIYMRSWHVAVTPGLRCTSGLIVATRQLKSPASTWQCQLGRCRRSRRADVTQSNHTAKGCAAFHGKLQLTQTELLAHYLLEVKQADGGHCLSVCQGWYMNYPFIFVFLE